MTKPFQKTRKEKRRRTPKGRMKKVYVIAEKGKAMCALCDHRLQGVARNGKASKHSKSERTPSAIFAGHLCNQCRKEVIVEAVKIKTGLKEADEVRLKSKMYVQQALHQMDH